MYCIATLALLFFVGTLGQAAVLRLLYVYEDNTNTTAKYLDFEEREVYRATSGALEGDKKPTVGFVIPYKTVRSKLDTNAVKCPAGSKKGFSIVFATDESNNKLSLDHNSERIQLGSFRPYNEADKEEHCPQFTIGSESEAERQSVQTEGVTDSNANCFHVEAQVK